MEASSPRNTFSAKRDDGLLIDAIALFLPLTRLIELKFVGNLFLHDILTPIVILFLIVSGRSLRPLRLFMLLLGVYFAGAVTSDFYRHSPFADYARGWSKIVLFGLNVVLVWLLSQGQGRRLAIYTFATGAALGLSALIKPNEVDVAEPWKFGLGYGVALMLCALAMSSAVRQRFGSNIGSWMLGLVALVSLLQNSRSLFAITALAAAYSPVARWVSARPKWSRRLSPISFMAVILAGMLIGQGLVAGYGKLAEVGVLGQNAQTKFVAQTKGDVNFIQGGRIESLVSVEAIKDSPILGHGSWAKDPYYLQLLIVKLREAGLPTIGEFYNVGVKTEFLIPTHSFLFGSWVESGILAVPVWVFAFMLAFRALYSLIKIHAEASALLCLVAFAMMWDVFFSPFAADTRIIKGLEVCILIAAIERLRTARAWTGSLPNSLAVSKRRLRARKPLG